MPDWFYRTVSRPLLFALPAEASRDFALGFMAVLCRAPLGPECIDLLGHMRADDRLARTVAGVTFPSPVGIGCGLDARAVALPALARFGVGFLEVGPVTLTGSASAPLERDVARQAILGGGPSASIALEDAVEKLEEARGTVPLVVRFRAAPSATPEQATAECVRLAEKLAPVADVLALEGLPNDWGEDERRSLMRSTVAASGGKPLLLVVPADAPERYAEAVAEMVAGFLIDGTVAEGERRTAGLPAFLPACTHVKRLKERWPSLPVIAAGGVHEPVQALEMMRAGADLVATDTGLVYTGPGLPKRINEAALYASPPPAPKETDHTPERSWFWVLLMGAGMLIGSLMALLIASTRIILPYDEQFVGMTRDELAQINPRLLSFLAHDRVSLAGAMIATGVLYIGLSLFGMRRGTHWAQVAIFSSAFVGFATFFLFLGYGYLDPFHAFVTLVLFQFLLMAIHSRLGTLPIPESPNLRGGWRWRLSQWGQLILIGHAAAVIVAGLVIATFGITGVFVPEDLAFMHATAHGLREANPRLLPLIAHDRASFGGNLVAVGLVLLLSSLWGFRPRSAWLWWTMFLAVVPAYAAAIAVHWVVGYTDLWHLTPAYGGLGLFLVGMALSYPHLCGPGASEEEWAMWRQVAGRDAISHVS